MLPRMKCLLVDDLEENLLALSALLRRDDVELLQARSGSEALELLLTHDVALAFLDVQMPDMDGFELAELMRGSERTRHVPIIFVTAGARDQHRLFQGYELGAVDFLYKPLEPHVLRNKAAVFFELYRQRQQLAEQLRERSETLRLNEMFTAVLGHDLRNPLSAILTSAELLSRRAGDEAVRRTASRILASSQRMQRLVRDLLDLTRARLAGGIPLQRAPTDLGAVVERVVGELQAAHPERRIDVARAGELSGSWDAERLEQLISNLVGNALQHGAAEGSVGVRVDGARAEAVELCVSNAGAIPEAVLPRLFEPFGGGAQREAGGGLGLGLYIVQQVALAHGGRVVVESDAVHGTVFRVELPRSAQEVLRL